MISFQISVHPKLNADARGAMNGYRASGAHRATMPKLQHWCDEAAVAHWEQDAAALP
jgi:hypothetical protein